MSSEPVISLRNISKIYRAYSHPLNRLIARISGGGIGHHKEFHALNNVNLDIHKGETVGIIGRNGSGKSTLLQLICGIRLPTSGNVKVKGRISALLELGSGFQPEFTGRENVFLQGAIMGFTRKEMEKRFDEIASFADIGEYIDQPVKTYSSGMYVRLAFAVAINVDPDILIVDEALSVGDIAFQYKSRRRMQELIDAGATLLVVSHDRMTISALCNRCILLERGSALLDGQPSDVFNYYHAVVTSEENRQISKHQLDSGRLQIISGTGEAQIESIRLLDEQHQEVRSIDVGMDVMLEFVVNINQPIPRLILGFTIRDAYGHAIFGTHTDNLGKSLEALQAGQQWRFQFVFYAIVGIGNYSISTALVSDERFMNNYECRELAHFFEVQNLNHRPFVGSTWLNPVLTMQLL